MKKIIKVEISVLFIFGLFIPLLCYNNLPVFASSAGNIYLQIEEKGEAWYVSPITEERFYLGRPDNAWNLLRDKGVGISNHDLKKIPIGLLDFEIIDTDKDGLSDYLENSLGTNHLLKDTDQDGFDDYSEVKSAYNPLGAGVMPINYNFAQAHLGYIFLQVEAHGEAWYVNPSNAKRYYLGQEEDAFAIMRSLGIGIKNIDLERISLSEDSQESREVEEFNQVEAETVNNVNLRQLEFLTMELVNRERLKAGLKSVSWNKDLATVAQEHSQNLAEENTLFTGYDKACDFPIIHHEGIDFGHYNSDRMRSRGIYYYAKTGENIALVSAGNFTVKFLEGDPAQNELEECYTVRFKQDKTYEEKLEQAEEADAKINIIKDEIELRKELYNLYSELELADIYWRTGLELAEESVKGWMNSSGHRENILSPDYDEAGIGAAYVNGYIIISQTFIKRANCGYLSGPCCEKIGYLPYCYVPLSCSDGVCGE